MGIKYHETNVLKSDSPLDVEILLLGLGLPDEQVTWEGPKGEMIRFMAVPEFGAVVYIVLAATISAMIVAGTRSKIRFYP